MIKTLYKRTKALITDSEQGPSFIYPFLIQILVFGPDGKKRWIGGEDVVAVAYDVPIPGYKTKTTINLRLWWTKASSGDFDLSSYNSGKHILRQQRLYSTLKRLLAPWKETKVSEELITSLLAKTFLVTLNAKKKLTRHTVTITDRDQKRWTRMSILTAGSSKFSSDRTIHEYTKDIWNIKQVELP
ncbi:hypothetical protein Bca101_063973 [Brassica carinata]